MRVEVTGAVPKAFGLAKAQVAAAARFFAARSRARAMMKGRVRNCTKLYEKSLLKCSIFYTFSAICTKEAEYERSRETSQ